MAGILDGLLLCLAGFWLGAIPFSLLVGRLVRGVDIRAYGDGNPGSINAFKASGWQAGVVSLVLDFLKGCLPTLAAMRHLGGLNAWMLPIAIAPVLGHAYSPWLRFKGGKAIVTTFGIWTGLTLYQAPLLLGGLCALGYALLQSQAWASVLAFALFGLIFPFFSYQPVLVWVSLANFAILLHKHRQDLTWPIRLRWRKDDE